MTEKFNKMSKFSFRRGCFIFLLAVFSQVNKIHGTSLADRDPVMSTDPESSLNEKEDAVTTTLRIMAAGDKEIILDPNHRDVILVLGNTGAGKSTITQFLAGNNSHLTSYIAEDGHYLIRDEGQKISFGSTLVSQSIFPELVIHQPTNTAFYDCPGFSDTRNASVEIANAFFIKRVAEHARRVKLLFIVNYSSLKSGQSRTDFKTLIEQVTTLVRNSLKFRDCIALIASKVDTHWTEDRIRDGIGGFLESSKRDLTKIIDDPDRLENAKNLIDSFLIKKKGKFSRIGLFRQPDQLGPLSEIPLVQRAKASLETIVFNNTKFVDNQSGDFHLTVSDAAKLLGFNLAGKLNDKLSQATILLVGWFNEEFKEKMNNNIRMNKIDYYSDLKSDLHFVQNLMTDLEWESSRHGFFGKVLNQTASRRRFDGQSAQSKIGPILDNIKMDLSKLDFLEQIQNDPSTTNAMESRHAQWLKPFQQASRNLVNHFSDFQSRLNDDVTRTIVQIGVVVKEEFDNRIKSSQNVHQLRREFQNYHKIWSGSMSTLSRSHSLKFFSTKLASTLNALGIPNVEDELAKILPRNEAEPINLNEGPFKMADWLHPLEQVGKYLEDKNFDLAQRTNGAIQNSIQKLATIMTQQVSHRTQNVKAEDQQNVMTRLSTDAQILSNMLGRLKNLELLEQFTTEIFHGVSSMDVEIPSDFQNLTSFYRTEMGDTNDVNLFASVSSRASPFKPFEWTRPLESVLELVQRKLAHFAKILEDQKWEAAEKSLKEQVKKMHEETERLYAAQKAESERHEREREEMRKREAERDRREREQKDKWEAERKEEARLRREWQDQLLADQQRRFNQHSPVIIRDLPRFCVVM